MKLTEQQKRVILENPHLESGKLAGFLGLKAGTVKAYRLRNKIRGKWTYEGTKVPFMHFDGLFRVKYKNRFIFASNSLSKSINLVDHLIWGIENDMFNKPRIEHPYFEGLKL